MNEYSPVGRREVSGGFASALRTRGREMNDAARNTRVHTRAEVEREKEDIQSRPTVAIDLRLSSLSRTGWVCADRYGQ